MLFLSWTRPTAQQQQSSINKSGDFNYDSKYIGATNSNQISDLQQDLTADGFHLNHSKILLGSGVDVYDKGKRVLQSWRFVRAIVDLMLNFMVVFDDDVVWFRHFGFDWGFVDPATPIEKGVKFCVCVKEMIPWVMMPLQVVYVTTRPEEALFGYGSGTLNGHLLAGEERFSIEMDENEQVWYEVLSISKPAHIMAHIAYPYVKLRQKYFANESAKAVLKHVSSSSSSSSI